jgi:magnesium-dependent phosphatase 1
MMGKKLLKHTFSSSISASSASSSAVPSTTTTTTTTTAITTPSSIPTPEASTPSLASSLAPQPSSGKPTIYLPSSLAALVPPPLLFSSEPLPRLIVFDLDYTLWPFWVDTHPTAPIKPQPLPPPSSPSLNSTTATATAAATASPAAATSVAVVDKYGETYAFYPDVPSMLWILPRMGVRIAIASRTHAPDLGKEMLKLMVVTPPPPGDDASGSSAAGAGVQSKKDLKPRRALDLFDGGMEIYPGAKIPHMQALARRNGVAFEDMLFFDDESRNKEVERLGVTMQLVPSGMSWRELESGVEEWRRRKRGGDV